MKNSVLMQADLAYYPFAERFDVVMPALCGYDLRSGENGAVNGWLEAMQSRDAVKVCNADRDLLLKAFK